MTKSKKVYVVPHSHWDREWYFTIEDSNVLLVENLDHLINVLENDPDYHGYVYDAQMSVIEEYLKIRPEQRERLQTLVAAKRIFVGPWYTQTDSLLVNKESIIRNLLYGTRMAEEMGHSLNNGYLPDIFGQNMYLPSIFEGFGIDYSILQRGIFTDQLNGDLNFIWKSPDGKQVKANNIYFGYGPGKFLSADDEYHTDRLVPLLDKLADMNESTDHLLLPAGGDQVLVRDHFPTTVKQLNEKDEKYEYILSDYETFMKETWAADGAKFDNVIEGELIASQKSRIHNTIRSQRYDLKKLNYEVENKLLYVLEPLAGIGKALGLSYPQTWLDSMWKMLFDVHAHDSIGGCNSDDTNRDIIVRLEKVDRIANGLINIVKKQVTKAIANGLGQENISVILNTNSKPFSGLVEKVLFTKQTTFDLKDVNGAPIPFELMNQEYISGGKQIVVTADGEKEVEVPGYYRSVIQARMVEVPAMGYTTLLVQEEETVVSKLTATQDTFIENELYRLSINGSNVVLENKQTKQTLENFIRFENVADAGDSYDFSPLKGDEPIYFNEAEVTKVEKGSFGQVLTVRYTTELPVAMNEEETVRSIEKAVFTVVTTFTLNAGEELLKIQHEIDNTCKDHRIRVLLSTGMKDVQHSYADQAFSVIERPVVNPYLEGWKENGFAEAPVSIYPLENFVALSDKKATFATITKGIKEYEVLPDTNELALTLFRSVGFLGRDNLEWRPGRASGINNKVVYTPDAQLQQTMTFEYAIVWAGEELNVTKLFQQTDLFRTHYATYQNQALNTFEERLERFELPLPIEKLPTSFSLFSINNEQVFLSTCKQSYEKDGLIVRLFNPTEVEQSFQLHSDLYTDITITNLYESEMEKMTGAITIAPKGYITLKLT
ncbi:glycoside hydrolase family 38 C-terminal domain-containing protein [Sutcliffiella sp. NC1]|uniref:glycoside hydrolase family 38 N-terminal domain-containing protein n=1 Tax=Sutcliffiella sp. NC1 TaxID=3004096 RepID=UPI0022DE5190|nr:glycoside hydrolase family 38 C-terminal domain-containing protein [Sutcliffiella sp. NC1]WBL14764.1 alpha-mannosidase [Sutcliffiella sp. NC1]